jgi:hypothetical protein
LVPLYHQHYPPLGLCESVRIAANHGIHLIGGDGLPILADVQAVAVDHLRYLLRPHPSVLAGEAVEYGFFYFHMFSLYLAKYALQGEIWLIVIVLANIPIFSVTSVTYAKKKALPQSCAHA